MKWAPGWGFLSNDPRIRKVLTAMHDGMSTFFIVTTSDLIGQDSKTAEKLGFKVHFVWFF